MIISAARNHQPMLFPQGSDMKFRTFAQTRNFVGDFFEVATAAMSGASRMKTDSRADICPDLRIDDHTFIESKSIGKSGSIIVYQHRAEKDDRFEAVGNELFYFLWRHNCPAGKIETLYELHDRLATSIQMVCIVPWKLLRGMLIGLPLRQLNSKCKTPAGARLGYGTNGYGVGWSMPYSRICAACEHRSQSSSFMVYQRSIAGVQVKAIRLEDLR